MEVLTGQLGPHWLSPFPLDFNPNPQLWAGAETHPGGCPLLVHSSRGILLMDTPKGAHYLSHRPFLVGSG